MKYQHKPTKVEALTFEEFKAELDGLNFVPNSGIMAHPTLEGNLAIASLSSPDLTLTPTDFLLIGETGAISVVSEAELLANYEPVPEGFSKSAVKPSN